MKFEIWLSLRWTSLKRLFAADKSRYTPLYKTGTRRQIGWHYRTDAEIDRMNAEAWRSGLKPL